MSRKRLSREIIIKTLVDSLEHIDYVYSLWEGGAAAFSRLDDWSDIDLYLIVDDNRVNDAVHEVETALNSLSSIEQKYEPKQMNWQEMYQAFYKIRDTSKYLLVDLAVLKISSPEKFLDPKIHGKAVFYFNKLDKKLFEECGVASESIRRKIVRLKTKFDMFNIFIQKEINRGNSLEAIDLYYNVTISILVEVLRIKHYQQHHEFKMRYVHYELPLEVIEKLEYLCFVKNPQELQKKYDYATMWFNEIIVSLTK